MKTTVQEQLVGIQLKSLAVPRARFLPDPSKHLHISSSSDDGYQTIKKCKKSKEEGLCHELAVCS